MTLNDHDIEQRRTTLLNDPNYGTILCFLDKFGSILNLPYYPLHLFEDHLIHCQGKNPARLIDFHFTLLKRISLARNAHHDKFDAIITRFAARFDENDSEHIKEVGYLQANIDAKVRIIKNLLESQFDANQSLKKSLIGKAACELQSLPLGRDRFGATYWLYMDKQCFIRLFREDVNNDRTWANIAKNQGELENFIKLLISDHIVRTKFPDWAINDAHFSCLLPSKDFELHYFPCTSNPEEDIQTSSAIRRSSRLCKSTTSTTTISTNTKKKRSTKRKRKSRKKIDDYLYSSTSSSDEHIDYLSEDEYDSDDYLPNQSQIDFDNNFFELEPEEEEDIQNTEQLSKIKTAQTANIQTFCCTCSKDDRPDVLLLCNDCNDGYHLECLLPELLSIPQNEWFCPLCEHRKLSNCLVDKFNEYLINLEQTEMKHRISSLKKALPRKTKTKIYSSDESITASEGEQENQDNSIIDDQSKSTNDDTKCDISKRGRHRHLRFDMKKVLDDYDELNIDSDTNDTDYNCDINSSTVEFSIEIPNKITRLLARHDRSSKKVSRQIKSSTKRICSKPFDLNSMNEISEELESPLVFINNDDDAHTTKSFVTNTKQTLLIARGWNRIQRRSQLKALSMKTSNEKLTTDVIEENSSLYSDDLSLSSINDEVICETSIPSSSLTSNENSSSKTILKKTDAHFDRLTRDIQCALNETHTFTNLTSTAKSTERENVQRMPKLNCSLYMKKVSCPLSMFQLTGGQNIFKSDQTLESTSHSTLDQTLPTVDT